MFDVNELRWTMLHVSPIHGPDGRCMTCKGAADLAILRDDPYAQPAMGVMRALKAWLFCRRCGEQWWKVRLDRERLSHPPVVGEIIVVN